MIFIALKSDKTFYLAVALVLPTTYESGTVL
ncbi:hypothetical protein KPNJ1_02977 [Klebsiella pneumoniae 30660/NJST258_1]|uniref:Uncharacterized protein n=1 Tax=Klebsiella pneumoniae 30684/NJST258_2 TaxID=1420013 RepID=W8UVU1_KLEPN|nr:hypothetical protein KPNJ2_02978 [Klebsiella pneumoniae 30684/NJST258_2]AHM85383.1 hypothetical protein KPNJ1_02977 [Klebsiella pneumoniae 30660/NJST258_1]